MEAEPQYPAHCACCSHNEEPNGYSALVALLSIAAALGLLAGVWLARIS